MFLSLTLGLPDILTGSVTLRFLFLDTVMGSIPIVSFQVRLDYEIL